MTTPPVRRDTGESLLELLIAITIMAIAFSSILAGFGTAIVGSTYHKVNAETLLQVRSAAEQVKAQTYLYCTSGAPPYVVPANTTLSVDYWTGSAWSQTCIPTSRLQRVRATVTTPGERSATSQVEFMMRAP